MGRIITTKEIVERFRQTHGNKYDYSETAYVDSNTKVIIICKTHGEFEQRVNHHIKGSGCPKCNPNKKERLTTSEFILRANLIHKNIYKYLKVKYKNAHTKVIITCPIHGDFQQVPMNHLKGIGCSKCGYAKCSKTKTKDLNYYLTKFKKIHKNKYDYSFVKLQEIITIVCPLHGKFRQKLTHHSSGSGCKKCASTMSKPELEVQEFITSLGYSIEMNDRKIIAPYELDIYIPSIKKAIEFNGEYWHYHKNHFEAGKHAMKSKMCKQKGVGLLHIREDLWKKSPENMKKVILKYLEYKVLCIAR